MGRPLELADICHAVARLDPAHDDRVAATRKASVAAIFRAAGSAPELLFIRRAEHPRDPWSGHMGFPGGRVDAADTTPLHTAIRETREEVGVDLGSAATLIGALSEVRTHLSPRAVPRAVVPYVFTLRDDPPLTPNHEVQEALWVPFDYFLDRDNRSSMVWVKRGVPLPLPCYRYDGRVIWGLTLKIVDELLGIL